MVHIVVCGRGYSARIARRRIPHIVFPRALKSDTCRAFIISGFFRDAICDRIFTKRTVYKGEIEWAPQQLVKIITARYAGSGPFLFSAINDYRGTS